MCLTMSNVVLADLHWEVKVNSLSFWELIIEHQMNNQGMIDGVFPQVTFSKEHRKIINLTPAAVQERLKKVLAELSQNGCLFVSIFLLQIVFSIRALMNIFIVRDFFIGIVGIRAEG